MLLILIGAGVVFFFRKSLKRISKPILLSLPIFILCSYFLTSFIIFKPKHFEIENINTQNLSNEKKAVIFYVNGEMEKYIPYYAGNNIQNTPYILKPIESYKIKKAYSTIDTSQKNSEILKISRSFRESLLRNSPKYFYNCYGNYSPNLIETINIALKDGCKSISVINFTNSKIENINIISENLKSKGVQLNISNPILSNLKPEFVMDTLPSDLSKFNKIIVINNDNLGESLRSNLISSKIDEKNIILANNLNSIFNNINQNDKNVLVINLLDFPNGVFEKYDIPNKTKKYNNINFRVVSPFKYTDDFLEVIINEYKNTENLSE